MTGFLTRNLESRGSSTFFKCRSKRTLNPGFNIQRISSSRMQFSDEGKLRICHHQTYLKSMLKGSSLNRKDTIKRNLKHWERERTTERTKNIGKYKKLYFYSSVFLISAYYSKNHNTLDCGSQIMQREHLKWS